MDQASGSHWTVKRPLWNKQSKIYDHEIKLAARADTHPSPGQCNLFYALLIAEIALKENNDGDVRVEVDREEKSNDNEQGEEEPSETFGLVVKERLTGEQNQLKRVGSFSVYVPWNLPSSVDERK